MEGISGLGSLVPLQRDTPVYRVRRDPGTQHEYVVNCHVVPALPEDDRVVVIGGRYGPTNNVGIYTIIVGDPGMPMPKAGDDSPEARKQAEYWEGMAFLITQRQLNAATVVN